MCSHFFFSNVEVRPFWFCLAGHGRKVEPSMAVISIKSNHKPGPSIAIIRILYASSVYPLRKLTRTTFRSEQKMWAAMDIRRFLPAMLVCVLFYSLPYLCCGFVRHSTTRYHYSRHNSGIDGIGNSISRLLASATTATNARNAASSSSSMMGDENGGPPTSTSMLSRLLDAVDVVEFSSRLKSFASQRKKVQGNDRLALVTALMNRLDLLDDELFSNCVWSLGVLRCTIDDWDHHNNPSLTVKPGTITALHRFWNKVDRVSTSNDRISLIRLAIGLVKMGMHWQELPKITQQSLLFLLIEPTKVDKIYQSTMFPMRNSRWSPYNC